MAVIMKRSICWMTILGGNSLASFLYSDPAQAMFYRCLQPSGGSIYTDSPVQLDQCTLVPDGNDSVSTVGGSQNGGPVFSAPPSYPLPDPMMAHPSPIPAPMEFSLGMPNVPPLNQNLMPPEAATTQSTVTCTPGLNPLNPMTMRCFRSNENGRSAPPASTHEPISPMPITGVPP